MRAARALLNQLVVQHIVRRGRRLAEHMRIGLADLLAHALRHLGLRREVGQRLRGQADRRQGFVLLPLGHHAADGLLDLEKRRVRLLLVLAERIFDHAFKRLPVLCRGALGHAAEHVLDKLRVRAFAGLDVVHHCVDVAAAVTERRIDKAEVGQADHPVAHARADAVFVLAVAERRLGEIDRADRAQDVLVDLLGLLLLLARGRLGRHIVNIVVDQNQIVARIGILLDDLLIQPVEQLLVVQLAVFEQQQVLLPLLGQLAALELQLEQVAAQRAGQGLFGDLEVFVKLVLPQLGERLAEFDHDLLAAVDIAAAQAVKGALGLFQPAAQLEHVALGDIHGKTSCMPQTAKAAAASPPAGGRPASAVLL